MIELEFKLQDLELFYGQYFLIGFIIAVLKKRNNKATCWHMNKTMVLNGTMAFGCLDINICKFLLKNLIIYLKKQILRMDFKLTVV